MTLEFFTYLLSLGYMLYKSKIINKKQLIDLIKTADENSDKSIEDLIEEMWLVVGEPNKKKGGKK